MTVAPRRRTWRAAAVLAFVSVLAVIGAACGSTVPQPGASGAAAVGAVPQASQGGALSIPSGSAGAGPGAGSAAIGGSFSGGSTGGGTGGTGGGAGGTTGGGTTGGGGTSTGGGGSAPAASAPGVTATTIYIGAEYIKNRQQGNAAIGGGGAGGGDARDSYKVMINQINTHGGIAGRRIVPVYYGYDATSSEPIDQQAQSACAKWTQDNKVFAILGGQLPVERECAKKAGIVEFYPPTGSNSVPETFQEFPNYVEITGLNLVRLGPVTVNGLLSQGYFDKGAKIGIVAWDDPAYHEAADKGFIPALGQHGFRLATPPYYVSVPQSIQDLGATSADVNNAVLKFASLGIDHVLILDGPAGVFSGAGLGFEFLNRAKSQHYYPRYGFNDNNLPADAQKAGLYPNDELKGSLSVAWLDGTLADDAGWHANKGRDVCFALMRKHGVDLSSPNAQATALGSCEELWFIQAVVGKTGNAPLTVGNFMAGVNALGYGFASPSAYGVHLSATQHDGIAAVRNLRFMDSCTCYKYTSKPYRP